MDACPSHAISLVPEEFPPQQEKLPAVMSALRTLAESKTQQAQIASQIAADSKDPIEKQLAQAISQSNRLMAEDLMREAGYMLPQSENAKALLESMLNKEQPEGFQRRKLSGCLKYYITIKRRLKKWVKQ